MSSSSPRAPVRDFAGLELVLGCGTLVFVAWYLACALSGWREAAMDDAYITYSYGRNLAEGYGLRFNPSDAEPTAGSSSLLHALFAAGVHARGLDPLLATRWLGLASVVAFGVLLGWAAARATGAPLGAGVLTGAWLALGLALLPETAVHIAGGMETLLFVGVHAAYLAWWVVAADPDRTPRIDVQLLGAPLALLLTIARPEGGALALIALGCLTFGRAGGTNGFVRAARELAWAWIATGVLVIGFLVWHRAYFGALLPNAYYVKSASKIFGGGGGLPGLAGTLQFAAMRVLPLVLLCVVLARLAGEREAWRARRWFVLPALLVLLGLARVMREMAGSFRYEFGLLPPFLLLVGIGALELRKRSRAGYAGLLLASGACLPLCFTAANSGFVNWLAHPRSPTERWRQGGPQENALTALGLDLARTGLGESATVLLSAAGQVPYWSRMRAIDWIGLNNGYLSGREPRTLDEVWSYIEAEHPDVVVSVLPPAASDGRMTAEDANFRSPIVQRFLSGFGSELFERWDRERVSEMFRREMAYVRANCEFAACYQLGVKWRADWWLFVYVRRDSPHREVLLDALGASKATDRDSDLGAHFEFDPRALRSGP